MVSTPTADERLRKPGVGDDVNTWGNDLNTDFDLIDFALTGWTSIALTGNHTLSAANWATDEARSPELSFTSTGAYTVTLLGVPEKYVVNNASAYVLTFTNGTSSVQVQPGETVMIVTDGASNMDRVVPQYFGFPITVGGQVHLVTDPTSPQDAATKNYVDNTAFNMAAGALPGQASNGGKALFTDGTNAFWGTVTPPSQALYTTSGAFTLNSGAVNDVFAVGSLSLQYAAGAGGLALGTVIRLQGNSAAFNGVRIGTAWVNLSQGAVYALAGNAFAAGLWQSQSGYANFGRTQALPGTTYMGSLALSATDVIVATRDASNIYLSDYNPQTGVLGASYSVNVGTNNASSYNVQLFGTGASSFVAFYNPRSAGTGFRAYVSGFSVAAQAITAGTGANWYGSSGYATTTNGIYSCACQLSTTTFGFVYQPGSPGQYAGILVTATGANLTFGAASATVTSVNGFTGVFAASATAFFATGYLNNTSHGIVPFTISGTATTAGTYQGLITDGSAATCMAYAVGSAFVLAGGPLANGAQAVAFTVNGATGVATAGTVVALGQEYGLVLAANLNAFWQTDVNKVTQYGAYVVGAGGLVFIDNAHSLLAATLSATTLTVGAAFNASASACQLFRSQNGTLYYTDNNFNAVNIVTVNGTSITKGAQVASSYSTTFPNSMLSDTIYGGTNAGAANYNFANNISEPLGSSFAVVQNSGGTAAYLMDYAA